MNDESRTPDAGAGASAETEVGGGPGATAESGSPEPDTSARELGPLLDPEQADELEARDRRHAGPGGEPVCPRCGTTMIRCVERHRAPRSDPSPFRVRLVCGSPDCRAWTIYNW